MSRWRALGTERQDDGGPSSPNEADDVAGQLRGLCLGQLTVAIPRHFDGADAEDLGRSVKLAPPHSGKLVARGNGDAGTFAGVPVRRAKQIDWDSRGRVFSDDPADAECLVVRMRENARDAVRQLSPTPTEEAEDEHEQVQQIEVNRHRG